ncbi:MULTISPECIES: MMPL family transporter [Roseivirga]|uniref:Transporter n=1 Tax=Roseivirga thermotolerans TaxID=1758176 RepID=A0ABQ3I1J0_9BACT|nr:MULTISPECIES: MMPL family transporter [Roseivirga]MEC7752817.1 MMPL family transporter [Bacteroidota bacterium]GHE54323.1 transporter [Roseivirga thermotolerans]|tara:strand:- start:8349 stop:10775 length:2427 start_codon:yes stop_codon:yes gene_type:complete
MWSKLPHIVLKYRFILIVALALVTAFMGFMARDVQMAFNFNTAVPSTDENYRYFQEFKEKFGEDGNILVVGAKDSAIYALENFNAYKRLNDRIASTEGISNVISLAALQNVVKNTEKRSFDLQPLIPDYPKTQQELDSLLAEALKLKFYTGQLLNPENGATLILINMKREVLNSKDRNGLVRDIQAMGEEFTRQTGIELHYSGMPFVRTVMQEKTNDELRLFIVLSLGITALILFLFFRSWTSVVVPLIVISVVVVWVLGTVGILNYKITVLTGLIPSIIVVIGIPNAVYLLNKYHQEFAKHGNKIKALSRMVRKIGMVTFITNFTTAIGFLVLLTTDIKLLKEFGLVAGINILATFVVSIVLIPGILSYLPAPKANQLKHLEFKIVGRFLVLLDLLVHRHRYRVFAATAVILTVAIVGVTKLYSVAYMVDDIPEKSQLKQDLYFFEDNFSGVMPLEIIIDFGRPKSTINARNLRRVDQLEEALEPLENVSSPVSIVSFAKAVRQAFYNGNERFYGLPSPSDRNVILSYLSNQSDNASFLSSFVDTTGQVMRVSLKIADIGSNKMDSLINHVIEPEIDKVFKDDEEISTAVTGSTLLFVKGNQFLIENLRFSLLLAFVIIAIIMAILFANIRMIVISLIPNFIPLIMTAGIMGYFGIPLKPSTALIFSIAFGISVDDSIHFLAKYRQELFAKKFFVPIAISNSIKETGSSMLYTSIILFFGFVIFVFSDFGGTVALGLLTSLTLFFAMFTNLTLLPALLMVFDSGKRNQNFHPLIEHYEFYIEDEDEEIDTQNLLIKENDPFVGTTKK